MVTVVSPPQYQPLWRHEAETPMAPCVTSPSSTVAVTTPTAPLMAVAMVWDGAVPPTTTTQSTAMDSAPWRVSVCTDRFAPFIS